MEKICAVYKSPKHEEMFLYVDKTQGLERVPDALLEHFGEPKQVMVLLLHPTKKLAYADASTILEAINSNGFFLQLPPPAQEDYMTEIHKKNTKY